MSADAGFADFVLQQFNRVPPSVAGQGDPSRPIMAIVENLKDSLQRMANTARAASVCSQAFAQIGWNWELNRAGASPTSLDSLRQALVNIAQTLRPAVAGAIPATIPVVEQPRHMPPNTDPPVQKVAPVKVEDQAKKRGTKRTKDGADKASKGLRHLSLQVCQKVEQKGRTTYGEVADELVAEILGECEGDQSYDEKNIRRRVYDALNVLLAMDMIAKDKKEIRWIGLPTNTQVGLDSIRAKKKEKQAELDRKQQQCNELALQMTAYKRIIARNLEKSTVPDEKRIYMPFIIVKTGKQNNIDCEANEAWHLAEGVCVVSGTVHVLDAGMQ